MTYSLSNNCTKNYYNRTLTVQVIVEDVVTWIFLKHSVHTDRQTDRVSKMTCDIDIGFLFFRLSVCLSRCGAVSKQMHTL